MARVLHFFFHNFDLGHDTLVSLSAIHLAFILVISIYSLYGLVDDLVDVGRVLKLTLPIVFAYPLVSVVNPSYVWMPLLGEFNLQSQIYLEITLSDIFRITVIPVYIMVVSILVNMHSGFNGLQSGLSLIILFTLTLKSIISNEVDDIFPIFSIIGALSAFYLFNRFPSRAFEGNIGALFFGSSIGSIIVLQEYWWFGFFVLIPHIFNFFLWLIWLNLMRKFPDKYLDHNDSHEKFGFTDSEGKLHVPNNLTLKWLPNYYFGFNEEVSTKLMFLLTAIFCLTGLIFIN